MFANPRLGELKTASHTGDIGDEIGGAMKVLSLKGAS